MGYIGFEDVVTIIMKQVLVIHSLFQAMESMNR